MPNSEKENQFFFTRIDNQLFNYNALGYTLIIQQNYLNYARSLVFCVVFYRSLLIFLGFFLLTIVFSVLQFRDSDHPFRIFQVFFLLSYLQYLSS